MQNTQKKQIRITLLYVILTIADFLVSSYNLTSNFLDGYITGTELYTSLLKTILHLLPLIALIFISKKVLEIDNFQKRLKIKKIMIIYLIINYVISIIIFILGNLFNISIAIFTSCFFYSYSWYFCLLYLIKYHLFNLIPSLIFDLCFLIISIIFIKSIHKTTDIEQ